MILRRVFATAAILVGLSIVGSSGASAVIFFAVLLGNNEVTSPTTGNPDGGVRAGDPDAYGSASIVQTGGTTLCFTIVVNRIATPTAAHIHRGAPGANGPVIVTLTPAPSAGNPGTSSGCVDASDGVTAQLITDMRIVPSNFYVNVHNQAFPGGALRGQLF
jgi:hypothetical protein